MLQPAQQHALTDANGFFAVMPPQAPSTASSASSQAVDTTRKAVDTTRQLASSGSREVLPDSGSKTLGTTTSAIEQPPLQQQPHQQHQPVLKSATSTPSETASDLFAQMGTLPSALPASANVNGAQKLPPAAASERENGAQKRPPAAASEREPTGKQRRAAGTGGGSKPDPQRSPDADANKQMKLAESTMGKIIEKISRVLTSCTEIENSVEKSEPWQWLSATPQYKDYLKEKGLFEEQKAMSPFVRAMLLNGGDFGHIDIPCGFVGKLPKGSPPRSAKRISNGLPQRIPPRYPNITKGYAKGPRRDFNPLKIPPPNGFPKCIPTTIPQKSERVRWMIPKFRHHPPVVPSWREVPPWGPAAPQTPPPPAFGGGEASLLPLPLGLPTRTLFARGDTRTAHNREQYMRLLTENSTKWAPIIQKMEKALTKINNMQNAGNA